MGAYGCEATGARSFVGVRLAVLVSGTGSILEAMLARGLGVDLVGADRPCRGLTVAADAGIDTVSVARDAWVTGDGSARSFDRDGYSADLARLLAVRQIDVVAMAGFGTVLGGTFFERCSGRFAGRVLNTHPSLLPAFPGWHAVRDALAAGVPETGCTVHVAIPEVDAGPILAQRAVPVVATDDEASLHERIKTVERELYPATIAEFVEQCRQQGLKDSRKQAMSRAAEKGSR